MLHAISWSGFMTFMTLTTLLYYCIIGILFYHEKFKTILRQRKKLLLFALTLTAFAESQAQDGNQGINQANTLIRGYYDTVVQLMYAIGGISALIGAVNVLFKWNEHHGDALRSGAAWFAGCIFLVVVATVIKSFFGL